MLTYSLLMIFITAITMFNREERSACYAMPCTPQVETWAKGLFLLVHIAFTTFFAVLHFQAQRLIAYMVYGSWQRPSFSLALWLQGWAISLAHCFT